MDLLGHVELDREGGDLDRRNLGEGQPVGAAQPVELDAARQVEANVEEERIEHPAGQLCSHVIANRRTLE